MDTNAKNKQRLKFNQQNPPNFLPLQSDNTGENFILRLKNGTEIIIPNEFNQHTLSKIILTLEVKL